jgi:hypothetical protein
MINRICYIVVEDFYVATAITTMRLMLRRTLVRFDRLAS